jgi:CBS domain-containing protein
MSIETTPVSSFMTKDVKTEKDDQNILAACKVMHDNNIGSVIIVTNGHEKDNKPVGIVTERDVVRLLGSLNPSLLQNPLNSIMSKPVITLQVKSSIRDAIQTMQQRNIRRLVISDDDTMVGMVTDKDIFRAIMNNQSLVPSLLNEKLLIQPKSVYDQFGQYWFSDILRRS